MPAFNEAKTVKTIIDKVLRRPEVFQLIVVDDGSTDQTAKILKNIKHKKLTLLIHSKNKGKGAAVSTGLSQATGKYILIQDADLEYDPEDYKILIKPIIDGDAEVVYGSRFYGPHRNMLFWHKLGNDLLNLTINILFDTTISDCETCYKLIPIKLLNSLNLSSRRFDFEIETTCKILKKGIRIYEVPISYAGREYKDGKKIGLKDGIVAFLRVLQYRFLWKQNFYLS